MTPSATPQAMTRRAPAPDPFAPGAGDPLAITARKAAEAALQRINDILEQQVAERSAESERFARATIDAQLVASRARRQRQDRCREQGLAGMLTRFSGDGPLRLVIEVDGIGLPADQACKPDSLGLIGMHERARILGGELAVTGRRGAGTRVRLSIRIDHRTAPARDGQ